MVHRSLQPLFFGLPFVFPRTLHLKARSLHLEPNRLSLNILSFPPPLPCPDHMPDTLLRNTIAHAFEIHTYNATGFKRAAKASVIIHWICELHLLTCLLLTLTVRP